MKRFALLLIAAAVAALAISYGLRQLTMPPQAVAALLPQQTLFFVNIPDFNRTRDQWHESDVYKLYREPALQEFLQRPLTKLPQHDAVSETLQEIEKVAPKDAFIGLTAIEENVPKILAGFRFRGRRDDAEKIIGKWRTELLANRSMPPPQIVEYAEHKIEVVGSGPPRSATVYDKDWFFASNDLEELKRLLDRVDHRNPPGTSPSPAGQDQQFGLNTNENFRAAMAHMPSDYAALFYGDPKSIVSKLPSFQKPGQQLSVDQRTILEQMHSICGTTRFDHGKIHDVFFVAIPKGSNNRSLDRSSVRLATKDTFFYLAMLLNIDKLGGLSQANPVGPFAGWLRKILDAGSRNGITTEDWKAAFDLELGTIADWPAAGRWPSLILSLPVKDVARANKLVSAMTLAIDEDGAWTKTEKDGVTYFSMHWGLGTFVAANPTIAVSSKLLVAGLDPIWVEQAMTRSRQQSSDFASSASYESASKAVPPPTSFFAYADLPLLYSRLDAGLRPLLLMGAAFMPGMSDHIDVNKLPPPEVVTKHLSAIIASQRYEGDGYVSESVGPITLNQAAIVLAVPAILWASGHNLGR